MMASLNALQGFIHYGYVRISATANKPAMGSFNAARDCVLQWVLPRAERRGGICARDKTLATNISKLGNKVTNRLIEVLSHRPLSHIPIELKCAPRAPKALQFLVTFSYRVTDLFRKVTTK